MTASSLDTTSAASAQSDSTTSSSSSNESFEYTAEDQNDNGGAAVSSVSSASVWIYIVSGAVLLSLIAVAYKKRVSTLWFKIVWIVSLSIHLTCQHQREEVNVIAKVNLMDEENVSTLEEETQTQRKKTSWWTKFRLRKKKQTEVQMVSVWKHPTICSRDVYVNNQKGNLHISTEWMNPSYLVMYWQSLIREDESIKTTHWKLIVFFHLK